MESIKKIKFEDHDCMCGEEDEHGQPLCCSPFECEISFCPIKQLIAIVQSSEQEKPHAVPRFTYKEQYNICHRIRILRAIVNQLEYNIDELEKEIFKPRHADAEEAAPGPGNAGANADVAKGEKENV